MIRVSVAMVTYNGECYLREQLDSILESIGEQDEVIISDDGSQDDTRLILDEYAKRDNRIKVLQGPGKGVKANVDFALRACNGKYIFLSDQDDIWIKEKVKRVLSAFLKTKSRVVIHDATVVGSDGQKVVMDSFFRFRNSGSGVCKNVWKNTYIGCCMAFRRELLDTLLPIPDSIEMHDQWIGVINDVTGDDSCFLKDKLICYRRHEDNQSALQHYGFSKMLRNRIVFIHELKVRCRQLRKGDSY